MQDEPESEEQWCARCRAQVADYLRFEGVKHGRIGEWPAWHVTHCASIWAIESLARPGAIGSWVICGDLPTDYVSSAELRPPQHPRQAVRVIAERWRKQAEAWSDGRDHEDVHISGFQSHRELAPLLDARAKLLLEWADDDSLWEDR
jgi:hypothetical protein